MLRLLCVFCIVLGATGARAQTGDVDVAGQTLAEIRLEIEGLARVLDGLEQELVAPDPQTTGIVNPGPLQQRVAETQEEVQRLRGEIEKLELRVKRVVADGNNRIGDLEFRLIELTDGDYSAYQEPPSLGEGAVETPAADTATAARPQPRDDGQGAQTGIGATPAVPAPAPPAQQQQNGDQPAATERQGFDAALGLYNQGDYRGAAQAFQTFMDTYPGGPLTGQAAFWRGEALAAAGDWPNAARSYLESFSGSPQGSKAPEALYRLGLALGRLDQVEEACLTLSEVPRRYPSIPAELGAKVDAERQALGCG